MSKFYRGRGGQKGYKECSLVFSVLTPLVWFAPLTPLVPLTPLAFATPLLVPFALAVVAAAAAAAALRTGRTIGNHSLVSNSHSSIDVFFARHSAGVRTDISPPTGTRREDEKRTVPRQEVPVPMACGQLVPFHPHPQ